MPGLNTFIQIGKIAPHQLFRYAMDKGKQGTGHGGWKSWEDREQGSIQGVLNAFKITIPKIQSKEPFDVNDILSIRKAVATNVSNIQDKRSDDCGRFRSHKDGDVSCGLGPENSSKNGLIELITQCDHDKDYSRLGMVTCDGIIKDNFITTSLRGALHLTIDSDDDENPRELPPPRIGMKLVTDEDDKKMAGLIQNILSTLYSEIKNEHNKDMVISKITKAVQQLEQIHPFQDCNCRTFCMVLLNALLMQQGLNPTILQDPNRFDGFSNTELVNEIKIGQQATEDLLRYCTLTGEEDKRNMFFYVPKEEEEQLASFVENLSQALQRCPVVEASPHDGTDPIANTSTTIQECLAFKERLHQLPLKGASNALPPPQDENDPTVPTNLTTK